MQRRSTPHLLCLTTCLSLLLFFLFSILTPLPAAAENSTASLEQLLLRAVRDAQFDQVIDYGPYNEACPGASFCPAPAPRIAHPPNVDVAVVELDQDGGLTGVANVLLSRDYPSGVVVPLDRNYAASSVRWRKWDIERWDGGTFSDQTGQRLTTKGWKINPPFTAADDIVSGREATRYQFMAPYPASLFKLLVAYYLMRLVDTGVLSLNQTYTYEVPASSALNLS